MMQIACKARALFIIGAVVVMMVFLVACSASPKPIQLNDKAPAFKLNDRQGKSASLNDYKGKYIFLHFWNTIYDYSIESLPYLEDLFKDWSKGGQIVLLTIDEAETATAVNNFMDKNRYDFPVLLDSNNQIAGQYGVIMLPISFLINQEGRLKMKVAGPFENKAAIEKMVAGAMTAN
jgi:peroxiredoxin